MKREALNHHKFERGADGVLLRRILPSEYRKWLDKRSWPRTYNRRYPKCDHPLKDDELPVEVVLRANELGSLSQWMKSRKFFMDVSEAQWQAIKEYVISLNGGKCAYCGDPAVTADHVVAFIDLGSSHPSNLKAVCQRCNSSKGSTPHNEWKGRKQ